MTREQRPQNVALIGYGYAGKTFHAPLIASVQGLQLSCVVSSDAAKVLADYPKVSVRSTADECFVDPAIDLIVIATPNTTHFPIAKSALTAGKHVVVDKPFTTTLAEAKELVALAYQHERVLSVFHNRRWDADFLTVRKLIEQNSLGRIVHFESHFDRFRPQVRQRWRERDIAGGGLWFDLGPHLLDQCLQLFGNPDAITVDFAQQRTGATAIDYFHAVLHYGSMRAILHAGALVAAETPRFCIHGTNGSFVKYGLDVQEDALKARIKPGADEWGIDQRDGILTTYENDLPKRTAVSLEAGNYQLYYEQVRDAIAHDTPNPVPAEQALAVMELIELGCESASKGRIMPIAAKEPAAK
jgi:predicted dehydrogenase